MSEEKIKLNCVCIHDHLSMSAKEGYNLLIQKYEFAEIDDEVAKSLLILGGDGFMLECLHKYMHYELPIYGMNCGTVGFLMNDFSISNLPERLARARTARLYPLKMYARTVDGKEYRGLAINEVSLLRESRQAAKICVAVDYEVRIREMIGDGIMVATPAGSTAYNFSVGGPIIPLGANVLAITPISPFRPRHWPGALVMHSASVCFSILEAKKRPVSAVADSLEIRNVAYVEVSEDNRSQFRLLFDPEQHLEERIIKEQFVNSL